MSDDHFDVEAMHEDANLEQMLTTLGGTVLDQEWAESEGPRPDFSETLRRRLVGRTGGSRRARRFVWSGGLIGGAVAAIAIVLSLTLHGSSTSTPRTAFALPTPNGPDLSKSYPLEGGRGGGGGPPSPTRSRIEIPFGDVYDGRVTLVGQPHSGLPSHASAYALQAPPKPFAPYVASLAHRLGIPGNARQTYDYLFVSGRPRLSTFLYVAHGGGQGAATPLRSIAVARFNGEVIYHDTTYELRGRRGKPQSVAASEAAGRAWLDHLGWPGSSMPVTQVQPLFAPLRPPTRSTRQISFGWPGVSHADEPAAVLLVNRTGGVSEALIEPMISRKETVSLQSVNSRWKRVQRGQIPIGINVIILKRHVPAAGRLQRIGLAHVMTSTPQGSIFLIPAYRFTGTVQIQGRRGRFSWVALAPATR